MAAGRFPPSVSKRNPFEDDTFEEIHSAESSRIQSEKQLFEQRILDSSSRSLRLVEESKDIACKTEEDLQSQEESLLRTEGTLDRINGDMDIANRQITSLKSIWGTIGNYFRKPLQPQKPDVPVGDAEKKKEYPQTRPKTGQAVTSTMGWEDSRDVYTSRPQNVHATVDKNLDSIMSGLTELKCHALLLGETLDRHDVIIDRVTYKATMSDKKIEESDKNIRKILKK